MSRPNPFQTQEYKICQQYCEGGQQQLGGICKSGGCIYNNTAHEMTNTCTSSRDCLGCTDIALQQIKNGMTEATKGSHPSDLTDPSVQRGIVSQCTACTSSCPKSNSNMPCYIGLGAAGVVLLIVLIIFFAHKNNRKAVGAIGREEIMSALTSVGGLSELTPNSVLSMLTDM